MSSIKSWKFQIVTLAVVPVLSHDSETLKRFVLDVLSQFFKDTRSLLIFDTTDGAANMLKLSQLLGHKRTTCLAHCLHNLLTTDTINKIPKIQSLITRCKEIVTALHFKTCLLNEEKQTEEDIQLQDRISDVNEELILDENNPVLEQVDESVELETEQEGEQEVDQSARSLPHIGSSYKHHVHQTLKLSVPTRWNTNLTMIESLLDLFNPVNNALKKIGKGTVCMDDEDKDLLEKLRELLKPFKAFTKLFSENAPNLALLPLVKSKIKRLCMTDRKDLEEIASFKKKILASLDKRLPETDLMKLSAAFDPGVWSLVMKKEECDELLRKTFMELQQSRYQENIFGSASIDENEAAEHSRKPDDTDMDMRSSLIFEAKTSTEQSGSNALALFQKELSSYFILSESSQSKPLEFWEMNQTRFPMMSSMAKIYLGISAGSVPVECMFSSTGLILNGKRSRLTPARVNMISFIHDNNIYL